MTAVATHVVGDLNAKEQSNVRAALQFLRRRCGGWQVLAKALKFKPETLSAIGRGSKGVSASLTVRIAKFAVVGVDDVLTGRFPSPGTCPMCGQVVARDGQSLDG
jgi:hypothetical protein